MLLKDEQNTLFFSVKNHEVLSSENTVSLNRGLVIYGQFLFSETVFLRIGTSVSQDGTFSKTQRSFSNETPCICLCVYEKCVYVTVFVYL